MHGNHPSVVEGTRFTQRITAAQYAEPTNLANPRTYEPLNNQFDILSFRDLLSSFPVISLSFTSNLLDPIRKLGFTIRTRFSREIVLTSKFLGALLSPQISQSLSGSVTRRRIPRSRRSTFGVASREG